VQCLLLRRVLCHPAQVKEVVVGVVQSGLKAEQQGEVDGAQDTSPRGNAVTEHKSPATDPCHSNEAAAVPLLNRLSRFNRPRLTANSSPEAKSAA
jgi:hypothetical protein